MEAALGRMLLPGETVHHKNGIRSDNRPENLELWCSWQPHGSRVSDLVAFAKDVLARYEPQFIGTRLVAACPARRRRDG